MKPIQNAKCAPAIGAIKGGLRGPVIDAIQRCVPDLRRFNRDALFERVLNTPELAALCFKLFRASPDQFEAILIGPDGKEVVSDHQPLNCGRTLAEVTAMIVRSVARRHFRAKLDGNPQESEQPARRGVVARAAELLGFDQQPQGGRRRSRRGAAQSLGDRVYRALRDHLQFEWQLALIPEYANIPLEAIPAVKPLLFFARDAAAVRRLAVPQGRAWAAALAARPARPAGPRDARAW